MLSIESLLAGLGVAILAYLAVIGGLVVAGRRTQASALARFIPDCLVLLRRLLADERVARRCRFVLLALIGYLSMPIDLVPDFVPVAGHLDDVVVAALALRCALRSGGPELLRRHWPGPDQSLQAVMRLAYGRAGGCRGQLRLRGSPLRARQPSVPIDPPRSRVPADERDYSRSQPK
jgi:uncharacterized membrane protein YkvA (DUF1232 family)